LLLGASHLLREAFSHLLDKVILVEDLFVRLRFTPGFLYLALLAIHFGHYLRGLSISFLLAFVVLKQRTNANVMCLAEKNGFRKTGRCSPGPNFLLFHFVCRVSEDLCNHEVTAGLR
jgi:hypothetical protein